MNSSDLKLLFKPDYTPRQMFSKGIFGGNYFNKDIGLPPINRIGLEPKALSMLKTLNVNTYSNPNPSPDNNFYGVNCGASFEFWTEKGWLRDQDPYGWVNWYLNYYYGRTSVDDSRQIKRWKNFKIRHQGMLRKYPTSKKIKQALLHWAIKA